MHQRIAATAAIMGVLLGLTASAGAVTIGFDDLPCNPQYAIPVPSGYAGVTWGSSNESSSNGSTSSWFAYNSTYYSTPHSAPNFLFNGYGVDSLWFEFPQPVLFRGAWFCRELEWTPDSADYIRFVDNLGHSSSWLLLPEQGSTYLSADFMGATRIYVQRGGDRVNGQWYTMDDVTYEAVPEPTSLLIIASGLPLLACMNKRVMRQ